MNTGTQREALRQRLLLRTLWRDTPPDALGGWLRPAHEGAAAAGLAAYRGNAAAIAERALGSAFPTVAALVGGESFAALAQDFWQHHPPLRGDLGEWGGELAGFIATREGLASEPYLSDSARLDWLVHTASRAADAPAGPPALDVLGEHAPEQLQLVLRPGCALLDSAWPVAAVWRAHQAQGEHRFDAVRAAFAAAVGEHAFVWRDGFAVRVDALAADAAAFGAALLRGASLAAALDAAGEHFAFDQWLLQALQSNWLVDIQHPSSTRS